MLEKKMKKIIITGATSMIGVALIEECMKNNIFITAISRKNSSNLKRLPIYKNLEIVECNLDDIENLLNICKKEYDIFYHFAWEGTTKSERNDIFLQNKNISTSIIALKIAKELGCHTFVGAGSQAEYGIVNEDKISPITPTNPETAYGVAKYSACKLTQIYAKQLGINHIWGRIFSVYGKWDNNGTMINSTIDKLLKKEKTSFTKAEQIWDYLYYKDIGRVFYLMGLKGKNQAIYCIGSGEARPLVEYIKIISKKLSNDLNLGIGNMEYPKNQVMSLCADISSLKKDTGFIPKYTFEEGIEKTIEWQKALLKERKNAKANNKKNKYECV